MDHGDEGYEVSGVVNVPLGDTVALRVVGFSARDAGFIDNVLVESGGRIITRFFKTAAQIFTRPRDFSKTHVRPGWAQRSTII